MKDSFIGMIKRLDLSRRHLRQTYWPERDEEPDRNNELFARRLSMRQMIVMIDAQLMPDADLTDINDLDDRTLLKSLLDSELVRYYRYSDDGPPNDVASEQRQGGAVVYPGWVIVDPRAPDENWGAIYTNSASSYTLSRVIGNAPTIAEQDWRTDAYASLSSLESARHRKADALAAQIAIQGVEADIYVSDREYLVKRGGYATRGVTLCSVTEAIALTSLYLRAQREYRVIGNYSFSRGLFFWVATRELLPAAWRWFGACVQHSYSERDDSLLLLAQSMLQRFDRALQSRDQVHVALNQRQNNDLREESLAALDTILVALMGAFDVSARVAHRVLGISGDEYLAAWQRKGPGRWWERIRAAAPTLADVVAPNSSGEHLLTIVRLLRNSVHGQALQGVAYKEGGGPQETLLGLPRHDESELLAAMDALGGRDLWGVRSTIPGRTHVDPGLIVERLFESVPQILNELMDKTPVERLSDVDLKVEDLGPPAGDNPFQEWKRRSIRWQLGL